MITHYTELQLDALRELANIGSGTAGTALSQLVGRSVDLMVPKVRVLPLADAVDSVGPAESTVAAVLMPIAGDLSALVLLLFGEDDARRCCGLLGVDVDTEIGRSAVGEIGNILGTSYVGALGAMTGLEMLPEPPHVVVDMLGAIVASALALGAGDGDVALVLDSDLLVEGEGCSLSFLLIPSAGGVDELLARLGLG